MKSQQLSCPACGHVEVVRPTQILHRLREIGMLRRAASPAPELLVELFQSALPRLACAACDVSGLSCREFVDDEWDDQRTCEACGRQIAAERLEVLPGATRCAGCEQQRES